MPLLSRVFKQPGVSGIHYYQVPGPVETRSSGTAAVESAKKEAVPPGDRERLAKETLPLPEDRERAARAEEERIEIASRQGYLEGLEEGKAEGETRSRELLEEAVRKLEEARQKAEACLQQARQQARQIVGSSEAKIVELSVAIAEKLIQDQLEIAPEKVTRIVQESIRCFPDEKERLKVYLHPVDLPVCREELGQSANNTAGETRLKLLPDERLSRGSCRVESENGTAEYLLDDELKKIRETLLQIASANKDSRKEEPAYASY